TSLGPEFLKDEWARARFDLTSDTAVVEAQDGSIAGYGEAFDEGAPDTVEGMGIVHPAHRGRGVGSALVRAQERRAGAQLEAFGADAGLCFLALEGDAVVGVVEGKEFEDHGWVNQLAVRPEWRGRGVGTFLLRLVFAELARRGHGRVMLNVDSENEAGAV